MPLNLSTDCDGYGKKFLAPHYLSLPKGGLVLERHNDDAKEWGIISEWALNPLCITNKPKFNSRTVHGERNRAGAQVIMVSQEGE